MSTKVVLDFADIAARLKTATLPDVDLVVGVATGGVVPASLVAYELMRPLSLISVNYRAEDNTPRRPRPELLEPFELASPRRCVLLVDDVSVAGQPLHAAKHALQGCDVTTLVLKGQGDIVLFPEMQSCIIWPWKPFTARTPDSALRGHDAR